MLLILKNDIFSSPLDSYYYVYNSDVYDIPIVLL